MVESAILQFRIALVQTGVRSLKGARPIARKQPFAGSGSWRERYTGWALLFVLSASPSPTKAQVVDPDLWGTDDRVLAIAQSGNVIYLGGAFSRMGPNTAEAYP